MRRKISSAKFCIFFKPGPEFIVHGELIELDDDRRSIELDFLGMFNLGLIGLCLVTILPEKEFRKFAPAGVVGLSINRKEINAVSDIFILGGELDQVILTVGHELGHILTKPLKDKRDEEAKAFAFSFAWMKAIKERNIGELSSSLILDQPARNGLHDLAHNFVFNLLQKGKKALEIYLELIRGGLTLVPD